MDKQIEKAYTAYMDAPEAVSEMAKDRYYKTLSKCQNEKEECESKIEGLRKNRERLVLYVQTLSQPTLPTDTIEKAEADPEEMRRLVTELVEKIYPYKIETYVSPATHRIMKNGVVLLEVHTIAGIYNILYDGNQRNDKTAYYINRIFATFQNGRNKFDAYDEGEYFVLPNASSLLDTEELVEFATFNELIEICKMNNWVIDYTYK